MIGGIIGVGGCASGEDSRTVRRAIERRYEENRAAFLAGDSAAVMRLRHPSFRTVDHRGQVSFRSEFAVRTGMLLRAVERFDTLTFHIDSLDVRGDTAVAVVRQRSARRQRLADGASHLLQTGSVQREWWLQTEGGWLMWKVDRIRPDPVVVDGRPRSP
jgi:hypothetical protein